MDSEEINGSNFMKRKSTAKLDVWAICKPLTGVQNPNVTALRGKDDLVDDNPAGTLVILVG